MALYSKNNGIFSPSGKQIIPSVTSEDAGKVLSVDDNGAWGASTAPDPLPEVTSADAGKMLTVSDAGAWEAAAASGGGAFIMVAYPLLNPTVFPLSGRARLNVFKFIDGHETTQAVTKSDLEAAFVAGMPVILYICRKNYGNTNYPSPYLISPRDVHIQYGRQTVTGDVSETMMMIYTDPKTVQIVTFSNDENNFYLDPVGSFDYT